MPQATATTEAIATLYTQGKMSTCARLSREYRREAMALSRALLAAGQLPQENSDYRELIEQIEEIRQAARDWSADLRKAK